VHFGYSTTISQKQYQRASSGMHTFALEFAQEDQSCEGNSSTFHNSILYYILSMLGCAEKPIKGSAGSLSFPLPTLCL